MRELQDYDRPFYWVSVSSIRKILHDATYVWKASRKSKSVIFTPHTALACVNYSHEFHRFYEHSGAIEHTKRLLFGEESTYTMKQVLEMVWSLCGHVTRVQVKDGKGGVSVSLFINGSAELFHVHSNIGQSTYLVV